MVGSIDISIENSIATIEFFHPKSNSLPKYLLENLASTITEAGHNEQIKVIILQSAGDGAFCAGASFDELIEIDSLNEGRKFFSGFGKVILAMKECPKFILGRVHGKAVGGGVGIIAAADFTLATDKAFIKLSELNLGIGPFVIAPVVKRKIGLSAFSTLSINASEWKSAEWAYKKGLYNELFNSSEGLTAGVEALANQLVKSSPEAMKALKQTLWQGMEQLAENLEQGAELSGNLVLSPFTKEFILAFKAKN